MEYYAGIDVSLEQSSVCIVDKGGKIVREAKLAVTATLPRTASIELSCSVIISFIKSGDVTVI